jgi:hypothetical protein
MHRTNLIVVEDFYTNPHEVREFALKQTFKATGYAPGYRTAQFLNEEIRLQLQQILLPYVGNITSYASSCGCFNYTTAACMKNWRGPLVHTDASVGWAGVLYLTPDAPINSGTAIYKNKRLNESVFDKKDYNTVGAEWDDWTKWELQDMVGNKFNRLVLYRGNNAHAPFQQNHFGYDIHTGRMTQVFFVTTEF